VRGKLTLDGKEYEVVSLLESDSIGTGRVVTLQLKQVLHPDDREIYHVQVDETVLEFNIGSMQKGEAELLNLDGSAGSSGELESAARGLAPGEALVIIRRRG
jgi:hypothetical protein